MIRVIELRACVQVLLSCDLRGRDHYPARERVGSSAPFLHRHVPKEAPFANS